ncbi:hypothetical protein [Fretibacter rubidus]|uniref:hypothetical protein n=1 Tax=Fretibacter rubidus TaxID=570162 RepID=UPI00352AD5D4
MTRTFKIALTAAAFITVAGSATAGDTFTATFNYDNTISASANLENFQTTATDACREEMTRAGFRITEGRREMRQCEQELMKSAVRSTKSRALVASYAARTVNAVYKPKPSVAAQTAKNLIKASRKDTVKMASN